MKTILGVDYYESAEVAKKLGITAAKVNILAAAKRLKSRKIGGRWLTRLEDILAYTEKQRTRDNKKRDITNTYKIPDGCYSIADVAKILGVHSQTISNAGRSGLIIINKFPGLARYYITEENLKKYIDETSCNINTATAACDNQ